MHEHTPSYLNQSEEKVLRSLKSITLRTSRRWGSSILQRLSMACRVVAIHQLEQNIQTKYLVSPKPTRLIKIVHSSRTEEKHITTFSQAKYERNSPNGSCQMEQNIRTRYKNILWVVDADVAKVQERFSSTKGTNPHPQCETVREIPLGDYQNTLTRNSPTPSKKAVYHRAVSSMMPAVYKTCP